MNTLNWNELWLEHKKVQPRSNTSEFWDGFAEHFRRKVPKEADPYVEQFYEMAGIQPGDTLFDMGCGAGTQAIPYAKRGHEVYAADFSQGMLDAMMEIAEAEGVADRIHPIRLGWDEDWSARTDLPQCDIAYASRSMTFDDLSQALKNMESVAIRRCCMGVWDIPNTGYDRIVAGAIGYERPGCGMQLYIMGELINRDRFPELINIVSPFRLLKYHTFEEGLEQMRGTFPNGLTPDQEAKLSSYCRDHLNHHIVADGGETGVRGDSQGSREFWQLDHSDVSTIAFIRWDKLTPYEIV